MAFNKSLNVEAARDLAKRFKKQGVIILSVDEQGRLEYASYGADKRLCEETKHIADLLDSIETDVHYIKWANQH